MEDESDLVNIISMKFKEKGFKSSSAGSVEEALQTLYHSHDIGAVWLDHHLLGKKTGLDFVAEVKSHKVGKMVPIFVVSNTGDHAKKKTYLKLGAADYYIKANHKLDDIVESILEYLE